MVERKPKTTTCRKSEAVSPSALEKPRGATIANDEAGPITQGYRLSTWRNPDAYGAIVYSKGA